MKTCVYAVDIDCAACAMEVEEHLKGSPLVKDCRFDYPNGKLKVTSALRQKEIEKLAKEAEEDIEFLDKYKTIELKANIDCAACAKKVENALSARPDVDDCSFSFERGLIRVTTTLSEDDVKRLARDVEEDIEFPSMMKSYKIRAKIDCAACAKEVENAINAHDGVESCTFDFERETISVTASLSENEIKRIAKGVEEDIEFPEAKEEKEKESHKVEIRIISALVLLLLSYVPKPYFEYLAIAAYLLAGYDVLIKAVRNIGKGKLFDENFLMGIATVGAMAISSYTEAAAVMIFYQIGEYFQNKAVGKSRASIKSLMDLSVESVTVMRDGKEVEIAPESVKKGETIIVKPFERIALDGVVKGGTSYVDASALTGESVPIDAYVGVNVLSGSVNGNGKLEILVTKEYTDSTAKRILDMVEKSSEKKSSSEKFITRFSRVYTPLVVTVAVVVAIAPPLLGMGPFKDWIYRAMMMLVVSCPCALVLSVPLSYFASIGAFAKEGVLVKGAESIERIARIKTIVFDKTGTLTKGELKVTKVVTLKGDDILSIAASLEKDSTHPIAKAIAKEYGRDALSADGVKEIPGIGLEGRIGGVLYKVGNGRLYPDAEKCIGTQVYVGKGDECLGYIVLKDQVKENAKAEISNLRKIGCQSLGMLSGDKKETCEEVSSALGLDFAVPELLPDEKLSEFLKIKEKGGMTAYCGDGINDAPTLASADVSIAMGGKGSDAAIEAADTVIMTDDISRIAKGIAISKKTERIVRENIFFALFVKLLVIFLAIIGASNMWFAIFADVGVALICVLNSMRCLRYGRK